MADIGGDGRAAQIFAPNPVPYPVPGSWIMNARPRIGGPIRACAAWQYQTIELVLAPGNYPATTATARR